MKTLRELVKNLHPETKKALEQSAQFAVQKKNYQIELAHWLSILLSQNSLLQLILKREIDLSRFNESLANYLNTLADHATTTPVFDNDLIHLLNIADDFAGTQTQKTHSGHLLLAMLTDMTKIPAVLRSLLNNLDIAAVQKNFDSLLSLSCEGASDNSFKKTQESLLNIYTQDLTEKAQKGQIDPVFGRQKEIQQMIDILLRRRQNNPILLGEAGVGKTAIVEGLALRIAAGDVPEALKNVKLHLLDLTLLQAGASVKGEFEDRLKKLLTEIQTATNPTILFIDEIHSLIGAGGQAGQQDAANILKPALARGELRTIGATTLSEYKKYFEKDSALVRRFQRVFVAEPTLKEAEDILLTLLPAFEKHHEVSIALSAIQAAVELSTRYLPSSQLPDKAIGLLDTACARVRLARTKPYSLKALEEKKALLELKALRADEADKKMLLETITNLNSEIKTMQQSWETDLKRLNEIETLQTELAALQSEPVQQEGEQDIQNKKNKLEALKSERSNIASQVTAEVIAEILTQMTGIPMGSILETEYDSALHLNTRLHEAVAGQHFALEKLSAAIKISKSSLSDPNKPLGVFLLAGPSGVGKTETALSIAKLLFGHENALTVINMSEFKEPHKVSLLTGSPPGYVGFGEGGILTEPIRNRPYSVLLLDEVDKAHESVMDIFYQVFDKGMLADGEGNLVNFRNTLIIMTANLGVETIMNHKKYTDIKEYNALSDLLEKEFLNHFKPAFLSRFKIIPYLPLEEDTLKTILQQKLNIIIERLKKEHNILLTISPSLYEHVVHLSQTQISGARFFDKWLNETLLANLAEIILGQGPGSQPIDEIQVKITKGALKLKCIRTPN